MSNEVQHDQSSTTVPGFNTLSIVGFILAFFISAAGLVVGIVAIFQIRRTGERGRGLAIAAIVISAIAIITSTVGLINYLNSQAKKQSERHPRFPTGFGPLQRSSSRMPEAAQQLVNRSRRPTLRRT
ncbi:DUF4190 domain-containing protein [Curtobacterium sp. MCBA15_005]|uniref:DUF4190 domain-containing protein n=1 Tax=Curtobacterium sp. MCBA15_005 TaxID=1898734 RepID=UPI0008DD5779|nr:DUF4190 domain-containing protein [Curtobacterium sp. MCBA15_005]OII06760.1 hypothetical protein BIU89_12150 [Curtobacterium sp. MCBA15_005]